VDVPGGLQPVDQGGGGRGGETELRAEPAGRGGHLGPLGIEQADQCPYIGVVEAISAGERGAGLVKLYRDRPELVHQLQAALVRAASLHSLPVSTCHSAICPHPLPATRPDPPMAVQ
jgi:hypothetical protein